MAQLESISTTVWIVGLAIAFVGLIILVTALYGQWYRSGMRRAAATLGLTYAKEVGGERFVERLRHLHHAFLPQEDDEWYQYRLRHTMTGAVHDVEIDVADVQCFMDHFGGRDEPLHTRYPKHCTVVILKSARLDLPEFRLQPEDHLTRWIERESASESISERNRVTGPDDEAIERAFNADVRGLLYRNRARSIRGDGSMLMLYHRETRLSPARCSRLIIFGMELIRSFEATAD